MDENKVLDGTVVETAEEIVVGSSKGCLKAFGIVGGLVAIGAAGYFIVKKLRDKKNEEIIDETDDFEDTEVVEETVETDEEA